MCGLKSQFHLRLTGPVKRSNDQKDTESGNRARVHITRVLRYLNERKILIKLDDAIADWPSECEQARAQYAYRCFEYAYICVYVSANGTHRQRSTHLFQFIIVNCIIYELTN